MSDNSFESVLSMITSNPELLNKISSTVKDGGDDMSTVLSNVVSLISQNQDKTDNNESNVVITNEENTKNSDTYKDIFKNIDTSKLSVNSDSFLSSLSKSISKNSNFLLALKPYLSKNRCEMIDNVVKISQIANIMNLAK